MGRFLRLAVLACTLTSLTACDDAINSYKDARARQETEALEQIFTVTVTGLQRTGGSDPRLEVTFDLNNQTMESVTELKGTLQLRDANDALIRSETVEKKQRIRGGHGIQGLVFTLNGADNPEIYEKTTEFDPDEENFKLEFVPDFVVFANGTVLRRRTSD